MTPADLSVFTRDLGIETRRFVSDYVTKAITDAEAVWQRRYELLEQQVKALEERAAVPGPPGPAGRDGQDGAPGPSGAAGPMGPMGPMGPAGERGEKGLDGVAGPMGPMGPAGERGEKGLDGVAGPMGPMGPAGERGEKGLDGLAGRDGRDGLPGVQGPQGEKGLDGKDGLNGRDGADGLNGKDGADGLGFDEMDGGIDERRGWVWRFVRGDQVKEFVLPSPLDQGVYQAGRIYPKGACVTAKGSYWVATAETSETPGDGKTAWRLAVKRGGHGS